MTTNSNVTAINLVNPPAQAQEGKELYLPAYDSSLNFNSEEECIDVFNQQYTIISNGGKNYVIRQNTDALGRASIEFFTYAEFKALHLNSPKVPVEKTNGKRTYIEYVSPAKLWLESPLSSSAKQGLTFYPKSKRFHKKKLNVYMGLGYEPSATKDIEQIKEHVKPYLQHIYNIICSKDKIVYEYLIQWIAHMFQKPQEKPEVAVLLKAGQGTGKGTFVEPLGALIGSHFNHAKNADDVLGRFNSMLENLILLFCDEFFGGSKAATDNLKTKITEATNAIERKGIDKIIVPCFMRLILATNHDNVVKIEKDERRYLYLEVSDAKQQAHEYFTALKNLIKTPEFLSNLLSYFLSIDISSFNPRIVPKTKALGEQKIDNLEPLDKWIYTILKNGEFSTNTGWIARDKRNSIQEHAVSWLDAKKLTVWGDPSRKIGTLLRKLGCNTIRPRTDDGKREYFEEFPSLDEMRLNFEKYISAEIDW